jgi:hypothetical protein
VLLRSAPDALKHHLQVNASTFDGAGAYDRLTKVLRTCLLYTSDADDDQSTV